jgi:cobalt-zinc-cadmium efflux system protein
MGTAEIAMTSHVVMPGGQADDAFLQDATQRRHERSDIDPVMLQAVCVPITATCALLDPVRIP